MDDHSKTKAQLIAELEALRAEVAALKQQPEALNECNPNLCEPLTQYQNLLAGFFSEAAQSNVGLFILDTNLRFLQINQALANINGYSIEAHKGQLVSDLLPDLAPLLIPPLQSLIETGQPISNFEVSGFVASQPDMLRHWLTSYFPLIDQSGGIIAVGGIVFEITQSKQTLEALRQSETNLRMAQQIAHVGSWHWDRAAKAVFWSEEMYRIHGCDPTQPPPQGTDLEPYIHPDDLAAYQALTERALAGYPFEVDLRIIRPNGDVRYVETRGEPGVFDEQGELQHLFGTVLDVTERKRVEEALRKSEFALREAQRLAHVGSWQWTRETGVVWSEEIYRIHGLEPSQPNPPNHAEARKNVHPDDLDIHEAIYAATIAGQPYEFDLRIVRPDGEIRYIEARGLPAVRNEQGDLIELFGTVMDVTDRKRVEAQLRASEANLARAQKIANIASWDYDIATQTCVWSEELYRIHQLDPNQPAPVGDAMDRLIHPDDLWIDRELIKAPLMAGQSYEADLRIVRASGETRHIETRGEPVFDTQNQIVGFTGTVIDITDRKRIEEKLRHNEVEVRAILTAIPDMLIRVKKDGTRLFISAGSLQSYNTLGTLVGGSIFDTLPPEIAEQRITYVRRAIETGERQIYEYEIVIDGDLRYEEARIVAINDEEALIVVRDITDRKRAEAKLQESNRRWESLLDQVQLMVVGLNAQGYVEYVNPFFLEVTEYAESEVINQHWFKTFVATVDQQTSEQHFTNLLQRHLPYSYYQNRIVARTEEERFIVWNNTVLQNTSGEVIGTISIGEDMTEQRKLERLKTEFISVVSHELRTPLTSMQVALSLLDEQLVDPTSEDGQSMIHVANEGVDRLVRLVNDILDLERLESGKLRIKKQRCNPADLLHTAIDQMKDLANQSSIAIETKVESFSAYADPDRIVQVLTNLLSNAIRFSPLNSIIEILVEQSPQSLSQPLSLQFSVKDQGRGIPADQLERIFERFQQVDASDSREKSGTGLGLAICRSIIHQHGGQIWAESTLGEGSTFYFTVPVLEDDDGNETYPVD